MSQPTLIHVPGILFRTILRLVARIVLVAASVLLLMGAALALGSLLIATWRTPRSRRTQLATDIVLLAVELIKDRRRVTHTESPGD